MLSDYALNIYAPIKYGKLSLVHIEATVSGGSGALTIDAAKSSPGTGITGGASGQATISFPKGKFVTPLGDPSVLLAESAGAKGSFEALDANGTGTVEFAPAGGTAGTAAALADNSRVFITLLVGRD